MINLQPDDSLKRRPDIPLAPMIDIMFMILIFFMTLSVYYQMETEISISVPEARESTESARTPGEIIINVHKDGKVVVNQMQLSIEDLSQMLKKISKLYPNQAVIIRADKKTHHQSVMRVLDACSSASIWNIAFATSKKE